MKFSFVSFFVIALLIGSVTVGAAQTVPAPAKVAGAGSAALLTDSKGMTLYVFDKDAPGTSACNGRCATNWPPLAASATDKPSGRYTIVTRDDGSLMWAFDGRPLYGWINDKAVGDTTGDGVGGTWHVARPDASPAAHP